MRITFARLSVSTPCGHHSLRGACTLHTRVVLSRVGLNHLHVSRTVQHFVCSTHLDDLVLGRVFTSSPTSSCDVHSEFLLVTCERDSDPDEAVRAKEIVGESGRFSFLSDEPRRRENADARR